MDKYILKLGHLWDFNLELPYIYNLKQRFQHTYIIGKSGMGKSALMANMADYDMKQGISVIYFDPKGKIVNTLTKNKNYRYISFNNPVKFNPLRRSGYSIDILIREFTNIMDIMVTSVSINPEASQRMREILTKAIKGFNEEDRNLYFLNDFLSFYDIRKSYNFKDTKIGKWFKEIEDTKKSGFRKASEFINTMASISSRLSSLLDNDEMKQFISNGENEFDLNEVLENGESLLINTNTSDLDNQIFLSTLFFYYIFSYVMTNKVNKPLMIYIDEFQSITNSEFPRLLQYARDAQVGITMAHHDFLEIKPEILSSIFGITSSFIVFNCGDKEAERMAGVVRASSSDIMDLKEYMAYLRLGTSNSLIKTFPPLTDTYQPPPSERQSEYNFLSDEWIVV